MTEVLKVTLGAIMRRSVVTIILVVLTSFACGAMLGRATNPWTSEATLRGHRSEVSAVDFSGDGSIAASAGRDGCVIVWDIVARREIHRLEGQSVTPIAVCISPDKTKLAVGFADLPTIVWEFAATGKIVKINESNRGAGLLAISHKADRLATINASGKLQVWNAQTGDPVATVERVSRDSQLLLFSPSDRAIVEGYQSGSGMLSMAVWDAGSGQYLFRGGSYIPNGEFEVAFGRRSVRMAGTAWDMTLSDGKDWSEQLKLSFVIPVKKIPGRETDDGWSTLGGCVPDHSAFIAFDTDTRWAVLGLENGSVALLRPRKAGDWKRLPHVWVAGGLGLILLIWLPIGLRGRSKPDEHLSESYDAETAPRPPLSLRILAYLTIFEGICAAISIVVSLFFHRFFANFGVLSIWAGRGLLRFSRGWRIYVLVCLWAGFIGIGLIAGVLFQGEQPPHLMVFDIETGVKISPVVGWITVSAGLLICVWAYWVLTNRRIRTMFLRPRTAKNPNAPSADNPDN